MIDHRPFPEKVHHGRAGPVDEVVYYAALSRGTASDNFDSTTGAICDSDDGLEIRLVVVVLIVTAAAAAHAYVADDIVRALQFHNFFCGVAQSREVVEKMFVVTLSRWQQKPVVLKIPDELEALDAFAIEKSSQRNFERLSPRIRRSLRNNQRSVLLVLVLRRNHVVYARFVVFSSSLVAEQARQSSPAGQGVGWKAFVVDRTFKVSNLPRSQFDSEARGEPGSDRHLKKLIAQAVVLHADHETNSRRRFVWSSRARGFDCSMKGRQSSFVVQQRKDESAEVASATCREPRELVARIDEPLASEPDGFGSAVDTVARVAPSLGGRNRGGRCGQKVAHDPHFLPSPESEMLTILLLSLLVVADGLQHNLAEQLQRRGTKPSVSVRFEPSAPAPGLEFMQGVMVIAASKQIREAGAAMMVCSDIETLRQVADEQRAAEASREMVLAVDVDSSSFGDARDAGALAALVRDEAGADAAEKAGLVRIAVAELASHGLVFARSISAPVCVVDTADSAEEDSSVRVLCSAPLDDDEDRGGDGVLLTTSSDSPSELAERLSSRVSELKSGKSKTLSGFLSNAGSSTQLEYTDEQKTAISWGKFVQNAAQAGLIDEGGSDDDDTVDDLDTERGDYRGF